MGLASSHLSAGWPEVLCSANSKSQVGSLGVYFFSFFPPPTLQVQGVSGTLKNVDKKSSPSLEGGGGDFWALWNPSSEKMLHQSPL